MAAQLVASQAILSSTELVSYGLNHERRIFGKILYEVDSSDIP
jgi:hypothetical protein